MYPSFIAHANYCWNTDDVAFAKLPLDGALLFQEFLDGKPERSFSGQASTVPLGRAFNRRFDDDPVFPAFDGATVQKMRMIAADDPAKFDLQIQKDAPLAVVLSGGENDGFAKEPVAIPINASASGASFLVTAARFNNFVSSRNQNAVAKAIPIGQLEVIYADESSTTIPLTLRLNINDWNTYLGGALCRSVVRGNDRNGALFSLYAIDWRNPTPEREIKKIVFSSKCDTGISPVLFAISLSNAAKPPVGVLGTPTSDFPRAERSVAHKTIAFDFSGKNTIICSGNGIKGISHEIVDDPQRDKVLEIQIPKERKFLSRAVVDLKMPDSPPVSFKSIVFDIKVDGWDAIYRPDFYLMKDGYNYLGAANFTLELDNEWRTVCIPRQCFSPTGKMGIDTLNMLSIRFFMLDGDRTCKVRVGNIYYCDQVLPCRSNVTTPVK